MKEIILEIERFSPISIHKKVKISYLLSIIKWLSRAIILSFHTDKVTDDITTNRCLKNKIDNLKNFEENVQVEPPPFF